MILKGVDPNVPGSDYVNANYVSGEIPGSERSYIATQVLHRQPLIIIFVCVFVVFTPSGNHPLILLLLLYFVFVCFFHCGVHHPFFNFFFNFFFIVVFSHTVDVEKTLQNLS